MDRRYELRREMMLADCEVRPEVVEGMLERLGEFVRPFADGLSEAEQRAHSQEYVAGLTSKLERKNVESIAYLHDQDRRALQHFIGESPWDHRPLAKELARQVGQELGQGDGVIVFDPSAFPKKGSESVGVTRQWCGRLGKVENCQVGVFMGYVSRVEQVLVDMRLYLPKEWAQDKKRREKCHVPSEVRFQTRHELALDMLQETGTLLPHTWVAGDDEMGRSSRFRRDLRDLNERYFLAVPSNTTIRDLQVPAPEYSGRGRKPKRPFEQVRRWMQSLSDEEWTRIDVRDGEKGPLQVEIVSRRVQAHTDTRKVGPEEMLVVIRSPDEQGGTKHDYYLSNAPRRTRLKEFARVAVAEHRVEECIKRAKSEAGLADYEVRNWFGWHHHVILSLIATWFLVQETRRGRTYTPAITLPQVRASIADLLQHALGTNIPECIARNATRRLKRNEQARFHHWKSRKRLPPLKNRMRT